MLQFLLEKGADPNQTWNKGLNALTWCAIRNRNALIPVLIEFKADVFTCDALGFTPLDHAVINGNYMGAIMLKRAGL